MTTTTTNTTETKPPFFSATFKKNLFMGLKIGFAIGVASGIVIFITKSGSAKELVDGLVEIPLTATEVAGDIITAIAAEVVDITTIV